MFKRVRTSKTSTKDGYGTTSESQGRAMSFAIYATGASGNNGTTGFNQALGKSTCLIRKQDKSSCESALKDLDAVLAEVSEDNEALLAESYLRRGDCLRLLNRQKESVLAYLHVDLLFASQRAMHAEALFHLGSLWAAVGHPERASAVREKLRSDYPQSSWTKKLGVAAR